MPRTPSDLERLTQAASILKAIVRADESNDFTHDDYNPAPALRAAVALIQDAEAGDLLTDADSTKLIEAGCVLKACVGMEATGADWGLTWAMLPAIRLIDAVIADLRPTRTRALRARKRAAGDVGDVEAKLLVALWAVSYCFVWWGSFARDVLASGRLGNCDLRHK